VAGWLRNRGRPDDSGSAKPLAAVAQEDTDGDQRITIHGHTTPFESRDKKTAGTHRIDLHRSYSQRRISCDSGNGNAGFSRFLGGEYHSCNFFENFSCHHNM
jgi:hypothetical protein